MKSPFEFWEKNAYLEFEQNNVRIYRMDEEHYLFVDQTMYASTTERKWYIMNVYPYATGRCLEIGLGLGVASKAMLANTTVAHLLTIESNESVIAAFGRPFFHHNILHADIYDWIKNIHTDEPMYDFIFVDHYASIDDEFELLEELATDLKPLLRTDGRMVFWIDENAPEEDQKLLADLWI